jgi:hypothetical protein
MMEEVDTFVVTVFFAGTGSFFASDPLQEIQAISNSGNQSKILFFTI